MTYTIDTELRDQLQLKGAEVDVFFFLRSICRGEAVYHAGVSGIASALNIKYRMANMTLQELTKRGLIVKKDTDGKHSFTYGICDNYRLDIRQKMPNGSAKNAELIRQKMPNTPIKNISNDNNTLLDVMCENAHAGEDGFFSMLSTDQMWREAVCMQRHLTMDELSRWLDTFAGECRIKAAYHASVNDLKRHFCDWLTIQTEKAAKQKRTNEPEPISLDILMRDYSKQ